EEREPISPAISAWGIIEYHKRGVTLKTSGNSPFRAGKRSDSVFISLSYCQGKNSSASHPLKLN
ncbi:MAG: hypothetical protein RXQ93_00620, partial [Caldisphaera sp.]